jgi:ribose/xylose/arabinose/galactoside ABC-type transport system permease subunit
VVGAVLGTLIFGVLRNALPQIQGAAFYDRLIVGVVVLVIVVLDQVMSKAVKEPKAPKGEGIEGAQGSKGRRD